MIQKSNTVLTAAAHTTLEITRKDITTDAAGEMFTMGVVLLPQGTLVGRTPVCVK